MSLVALIPAAVATLKRNLKSKSAQCQIRVALAIIVLAGKAEALANLATEVDELRAMVEGVEIARRVA